VRHESSTARALHDETIEHQLRTLGSEVVRVAERFAVDESPDHARECARAAERVELSAWRRGVRRRSVPAV
jgi:hypothetical protein